MQVLIVFAHPEPTSLTRQLVQVSVETLEKQGHDVVLSDLYGMKWKAVFDADDFPVRANPERLSFIEESGMLTRAEIRRRMSSRNRQN